ncbi:MAG: hypothetical protein QM774_05790 [Gordonia sp. (in: high G+C Gram-positive bacteria)]|uniref:hypothetical protein n=1 Tax=Gordonia sp. (in: high G+C Gram-positive bacteria) TaxID=84139 RepID=UPI0039E26EBE
MTLLADRPASTGTRTTRTASHPAPRPSRRRAVPQTPATPAGMWTSLRRIPFIVPILFMVIAALGLTLYLSTKAAQDSYSLESVRRENQLLTDKRDELKKTADMGASSPELADAAAKLGMVPMEGAAHLVVGADGKSHLKGELTPAQGKALGSLNPEPDPVADVDASKVDDSTGLDGSPAPTTAPAADHDTPAPATAAPSDAPAPNVLPSSAATPDRNAARAR